MQANNIRQLANPVPELDEIQQMIAAEDHDAAIDALQRLVQEQPDFGMAHAELASLYFNTGELATAREHFIEAARHCPENPQVLKDTADFLYAEMNDGEAALTHYRQLLRCEPENVEALMICGHLHVAQEQFPEALGFYQQALALDPHFAQAQQFHDAVENKIKALEAAGPEEAVIAESSSEQGLQQLEALLVTQPDNARTHNDIGLATARRGNPHRAQYHFEQALRLEADNALYMKNLADFYSDQLENHSAAIDLYAAVLKKHPHDIETMLAMGKSQQRQQALADAALYFQRVLELEPDHPDAGEHMDQLKTAGWSAAPTPQIPEKTPAKEDLETLKQLASDCWQAQDTKGAKSNLEKAIQSAPDDPSVRKMLADVYYAGEDRIDEAIGQLQVATHLDSEDVDAWLLCAHLLVLAKRFDQAETHYRKVLQLVPEHGEANTCIEGLARRYGKAAATDEMTVEQRYTHIQQAHDPQAPEETIRSLEQLIHDSSDFAPAHNDLGVLYYQTRQYEKALAHYETAAGLVPENPVFAKNLADFYIVEQSRAGDALALYVRVLEQNPCDMDSLMSAGMICMQIGNNPDAVHFFERALEVEPWNEQAGQWLEKTRSEPAAATICADAEMENPFAKNVDTNADALNGIEWQPVQKVPAELSTDEKYQKAQSLVADENPTDAIELLKEVVHEDPGFATAYNDLGVLYIRLGDADSALAAYEQAVAQAPENEVFKKNLADLFSTVLGRHGDALNIYVALLQESPHDVELLTNIGHICLMVQRFDDAQHFYNRVLEVEPWNEEIQQNLDQLQQRNSATA